MLLTDKWSVTIECKIVKLTTQKRTPTKLSKGHIQGVIISVKHVKTD